MMETLQVGDLIFEVRHSLRRRTFGLTVDRGGELVVHVPAVAADEAITKWINKKLLWVHRKLALKEQAAPKMRAPEYVSGEGFCYLGRRFASRSSKRHRKLCNLMVVSLSFGATPAQLRRISVAGIKSPGGDGSAVESNDFRVIPLKSLKELKSAT